MALCLGVLVMLGGCGGPSGDPNSGGDATIEDASGNAFSLGIPGLSSEERRAFSVGNSFFNDNWVTAPASTEGRDGLGPLFNAASCSSCHFKDGRARPPAEGEESALGLLLRLSTPGEDPFLGGPVPDPAYGDQLQDRAINGVEPEGRIALTHEPIEIQRADGTVSTLALPIYTFEDLAYGELSEELLVSPRIAPIVAGSGLVEAIPDDAISAAADPDDEDGDGISGRVNMVWDARAEELRIGRFGWKANVPTLEQQTAAAFLGDIGITSPLFPDPGCTEAQASCHDAPSGGEPEIDQQKIDRIVFYLRTLAVPARRDVENDEVRHGEEIFSRIGCSSCHMPTVETGDSPIEELSNQTIHPYTDLLLHDMGPALADGRPDFGASGSEWRTPPLWGIGLVDDRERPHAVPPRRTGSLAGGGDPLARR